MQGQWDGEPLRCTWTSAEHTPTPPTLTPAPADQALAEAEGEGDSGFQEVGVCSGLPCPPLVSPERARGALMLGSSQQLVPMVGPQHSPVGDELSTSYMDKARQASEYGQVLYIYIYMWTRMHGRRFQEREPTATVQQLSRSRVSRVGLSPPAGGR